MSNEILRIYGYDILNAIKWEKWLLQQQTEEEPVLEAGDRNRHVTTVDQHEDR